MSCIADTKYIYTVRTPAPRIYIPILLLHECAEGPLRYLLLIQSLLEINNIDFYDANIFHFKFIDVNNIDIFKMLRYD